MSAQNQLIVMAFVGLGLGAGGCDLTRLTANQTAGLFERAAPAFDQHWDYEFAGQAAPASIMQLEGVLRVVPDNEALMLELAKGYTGYAYGWLEDELERVDPMDLEHQDHLRQRARLMYMRARNLGFRLIGQREDGFDEVRAGALPAFEAWLAEECDDAEDAPMLFWTGYSWGSAINMARDDPEMIADLPFARALVERSVALDPGYYSASGLTFLAYVKADFPQALGGDPEGGRALFEQALERTHRAVLVVQVNFARSYAVQTQNRELFESLLHEVLEAGDVSSEARLVNKIARRRALRLLNNADEFF